MNDQLSLPLALDAPEWVWRDCVRCQVLGFPGRYPRQFFGQIGRLDLNVRWRKICKGCEDETEGDRLLWRSLAQRVRHHAGTLGIPLLVLRRDYGMETGPVVTWFKRIWEGGTLACGCLTTEMHHGWRDAEIDRVDPKAQPFFPQNWQVTCSVHNNSKARSKPTDFAARQRGWKLWRESRASSPTLV